MEVPYTQHSFCLTPLTLQIRVNKPCLPISNMTINTELCSKLNILFLTIINLIFIPKTPLIDAHHVDLTSLGLTLCVILTKV